MSPRLLVVVVVLAPLLAQDRVAVDKPVYGDLDLTKPIALGLTVGHIHTAPINCKGQPDGLAGKFNGVYYACIGGKEVCSEEKGKIPRQWIADFDAQMRQFDADMAEFRRKQVAEGRVVSENPQRNLEAALVRHRAMIAEARAAKAEGRRPNFAAAVRAAELSAAQQTTAVAAVTPRPAVGTPISNDAAAKGAVANATVQAAVAEEAVRALGMGTPRSEVLAQLGEPKFRLSGGVERWTYALTNSGAARLEFRNGKLADIQITPAP